MNTTNIKPSILMTGATGLVGSRFVDMYSSEYEIFNIDLTTGVDITDKNSIEQFVISHPAKVLIHLAAFTNTAEAFKQQGDKTGICYQVNVVGTQNIAEVCKAHGIHLIHISTDFVFDGNKTSPYLEDDPLSPIEWYGATKAEAETVVQNSGAAYTILRIAYPYRGSYDLKPDLIQKLHTGLSSGTLFPQFADTIITPTFIDDIARAFAKVAKMTPIGIYHIVGGTALSPYDLAVKVAVAYGFDPKLVKKGSLTEYLKNNPRPFARYAGLSNHKAVQQLGLSFLTIDDGLAELIKQQSG